MRSTGARRDFVCKNGFGCQADKGPNSKKDKYFVIPRVVASGDRQANATMDLAAVDSMFVNQRNVGVFRSWATIGLRLPNSILLTFTP